LRKKIKTLKFRPRRISLGLKNSLKNKFLKQASAVHPHTKRVFRNNNRKYQKAVTTYIDASWKGRRKSKHKLVVVWG